MVAHIPGMVQKALSAAKTGPCSRVKKISATTESWGVAAMSAPRRGPSRSTAAVTPRTKPADTTTLATSRMIQEEPGGIARGRRVSAAHEQQEAGDHEQREDHAPEAHGIDAAEQQHAEPGAHGG